MLVAFVHNLKFLETNLQVSPHHSIGKDFTYYARVLFYTKQPWAKLLCICSFVMR